MVDAEAKLNIGKQARILEISRGAIYCYRISPGKRGLNRDVVPGHAAIVRRIFDDYADGISSRAIAARLNEDGIPSPSGRKWNPEG